MEEQLAEQQKRIKRIRLLAFLGLIVTLLVAGKYFGLDEYVKQDKIRGLIDSVGAWGFLLYIGLFAVGLLVQVPGMVFVAAGVFAYGKLVGGALAFVGSVVAVTTSFVVVRSVGGKALTDIKWEWVQRVLAKLDERPITTVIILRLLTWLAPYMNYALALSNLKLRDFLIGSSLGLLPPIALAVIFFEWAIKTFL